MSASNEIDFGPLADLIGVWQGDQGTDLAPEPDGSETNPYFETITVSAVGDVVNAESQTLAVVHYRQVVQRKSDGQVFHDETGYWMWDAARQTTMHSLVIPRSVCVLAGGTYSGEKDADGRTVINVEAKLGDASWGILQFPFMQENARTTEFKHHVTVGNGKLSYAETTIIEIYGKTFVHTDENELVLQ